MGENSNLEDAKNDPVCRLVSTTHEIKIKLLHKWGMFYLQKKKKAVLERVRLHVTSAFHSRSIIKHIFLTEIRAENYEVG